MIRTGGNFETAAKERSKETGAAAPSLLLTLQLGSASRAREGVRSLSDYTANFSAARKMTLLPLSLSLSLSPSLSSFLLSLSASEEAQKRRTRPIFAHNRGRRDIIIRDTQTSYGTIYSRGEYQASRQRVMTS